MACGEKMVDEENVWSTLGHATRRREYSRNVPAPSQGFFLKRIMCRAVHYKREM
jgi:hypothetical protein